MRKRYICIDSSQTGDLLKQGNIYWGKKTPFSWGSDYPKFGISLEGFEISHSIPFFPYRFKEVPRLLNPKTKTI